MTTTGSPRLPDAPGRRRRVEPTALRRAAVARRAVLSRLGCATWLGRARAGRLGHALAARRALLTLAVLPPVFEAALATAFRVPAGAPLAPQAAGPAPYGVFHDLRWVLVDHRSVAGFAVELAALWAARSLLSALLLRAAWPRGPAWQRRPTLGAAWWWAAAFTGVCGVLVALPAGLMFAAAVASVSWLAFAAVPAVLVVAVLVGAGNADPGWWRRPAGRRVAGLMAVTFAAYSGLGAALAAGPAWATVPVAVLGGLYDAWAWRALAAAVARRPDALPAPRRRRVPAPVALAAFAAVLVGGSAIGFHVTRLYPRLRPPPAPPVAGQPVVVASGFGTPWDGTPPRYLGAGFAEWRFSYAGLTAGQRPRPFLGRQTYAPLPVLARRLGAEVAAAHAATGRPVMLVAESEGALVAETYLHATAHPPVSRVVLLSPLLEPGRVYYPPPGQGGFGVVAGDELRLLSRLTRGLGSEQINGDSPVLRSVADRGATLRGLLACPVAGVAQLAVQPLADATSTRYGTHPAMPTVVVAGFHGGLLARPDVDALAAAFLRTGRVPASPVPHPVWAAAQAGAAAWLAPSLPVPANPAWRGQPVPGTAAHCAAVDGALHRWVRAG